MVNFNSKVAKIQEHLQQGYDITSMEAFNRWKATRLSAVVYLLKKRGMKIKNMQKELHTNYAIYRLED